MNLLQQLVKKGIIDQEKASSLEFEIKETGRREEEVILERKVCEESFLFSLKSENLKIPLKEIPVAEVSLETLGMIPEETAKHYQMIPLAKKDKVLEVGMVYPEDLKAQEALKFLARRGNYTYQVFLITLTAFAELLKQYRTLKREVGRALESWKWK